jgi:transcriptional regulator with XRE-family HTH domain
MITLQIGKRLAQIRNELASPGEDTWTQVRLADETGLTPNQIARLEQAGAGSIETFVRLLNFYHSHGYSLSWLLLPDNTMVSKMAIAEASKSLEATTVLSMFDKLKQVLDNELDDLSMQVMA